MKSFATCLTVLAVAAGLAADVVAQGAPAWNRRAAGVAALPSGTVPGMYDLAAVWSAGIGQPTSVPLDLSTEVAFMIDGVEIGRQPVGALVSAGAGGCAECGQGCGAGFLDGAATELECMEDENSATGDCTCQFPPITTLLGMPVPLESGDEIMVILYPAPGALPDADTGDDRFQETASGGPMLWDRRIVSADVVPSPGAPPGVYDVHVEWTALTVGMSTTMDVTPQIVLLVDGVEMMIYEPPCGPWIAIPGGSCGVCDGGCGTLVCNGSVTQMRCQYDVDIGWCACTPDTACYEVIPGLAFQPEDQIEVILRPVPGALPELPGFEEEDDVFVPVYDPWQDLGNALAGTYGDPVSLGTGSLQAGEEFTLNLGNALENTIAYLVFGFFELNVPFKGGVMVPNPTPPGIYVPLPTGAGNVNLAGLWPDGIPANFSIYIQWWILDDGGPFGFAASNAISGTTAP